MARAAGEPAGGLTYNELVAISMRLAAVFLVAVLCADLAGFDCSRLAAASGSGAAACCSLAGSDSPDCLCCSVADETVRTPPGGGAGQVGSACCAPPTAPVDGVRTVPYRPPLSLLPPSVI